MSATTWVEIWEQPSHLAAVDAAMSQLKEAPAASRRRPAITPAPRPSAGGLPCHDHLGIRHTGRERNGEARPGRQLCGRSGWRPPTPCRDGVRNVPCPHSAQIPPEVPRQRQTTESVEDHCSPRSPCKTIGFGVCARQRPARSRRDADLLKRVSQVRILPGALGAIRPLMRCRSGASAPRGLPPSRAVLMLGVLMQSIGFEEAPHV